MKVLFAMGSSQKSKNIVDRYYNKYGETLEYKDVFYFKALLDEVKRNKNYNIIVINEELEQYVAKDIEQIDRKLFSIVDSITDEAQDADIFYICSARRAKDDPFIVRLYSIGIYNILLGDDRNVNTLCNIIKKPKTKREAKEYLNIDSTALNETSVMRDDEVDETQMLNIINYYEKIKDEPEKYIETFDRIASQYSRSQLKVIVSWLPKKVQEAIYNETKYKFLLLYDGKEQKNLNTENKDVKDNKKVEKKHSQDFFGVFKKNKSKQTKNQISVENIKPIIETQKEVEFKSLDELEEKNIEKAKKELAEKADILEEEARKEIEEQQEAAEKVRKEAEERIRQEKAEREKKEAEIKEQQELAEKARKEAEIKQQQELAEKARKEAEIKQQQELAEKARKEAEIKEQQELAEKARKEAEAKEQQELAEKARKEAERKEQQELAEKARKEAEVKEQQELAEKARKEAEIKQQQELVQKEQENIKNQDVYNNIIIENNIVEEQRKYKEQQEKLALEQEKVKRIQDELEEEKRKLIEEQQKIVAEKNELDTIKNIESSNAYKTSTVVPLNYKKMILFVGANKAGTTFLVNAIANNLVNQKILTSILDMTKDRSMYYIYNQSDSTLRKIAAKCIKDLCDGIDTYMPISKYLKVYTAIPSGGIADSRRGYKHKSVIETVKNNCNVTIIDADFTTPIDYFEKANEIYIVQDMDILKIQETTMFLREMKNRNMDMSKIRIIINKYVKNALTPKRIIEGLSYYKDPEMTFIDTLLNNKVMYSVVPYNLNNYVKYTENLYKGTMSFKGYSADFMEVINEITKHIYPSEGSYKKNKNGFFG